MKQILLLATILVTLLFADTGTLRKVVDGDTLYFYSRGKTVKCRLAWIDTPESHYNARVKKKAKRCPGIVPARMVEAGKKAADHTRSLVKRGKGYRYEVTGGDRYGRKICVVRLPGGEILNEVMVRDGYAAPFWKYIPASMAERMGKLSREAKRKKAGLWKDYRPVMECLER
jgi:micrococcal nuclease